MVELAATDHSSENAMRVSLFDEMYEYGEPDVYMPRRLWCDECRRPTAFRYDQFDMPICIEHADEEEAKEIES